MNIIRRNRAAKEIEEVSRQYIRTLDGFRDVPEGLEAMRWVIAVRSNNGVYIQAEVEHVSRPYPPDSISRPDWARGLLMELTPLLCARGYVLTVPTEIAGAKAVMYALM